MEQLQEVRWILVGTHCVLQAPDHHIEFSMTLHKVGLDNLSTSVGHAQNFLAVDMSANLAPSSNVTTVVCSCPEHCTSSEVEAAQLSPLCSWPFGSTCTPVPILIPVLTFPVFLFITSTISHCLVNVLPLGILLGCFFS